MIDDLVCPAVCGLDSVLMNSFINAKTNTKKLQFGVKKCHQLHVGRKNSTCPKLEVDNWELEKVDESETGLQNLEEVMVESHTLEKLDEDKYLGDIISVDGKNSKNIKARKGKAAGIIKQIITILHDICFGPFQFEVALILRDSLFLNSVLVNSEAWYGLTEEETSELEREDENLLRKILEAPSKSPKCMLYLETGCKPIRFMIMKRQLMFLHYILNEEENSLIRRFLNTQEKNPGKNDWVLTVKKTLETLEIYLDFDQIKEATRQQFKSFVDKAINEKCFNYLIDEKNKKNKVKHIQYYEHETQEYLLPGKISNKQAKEIFLLRTRMLETKDNYQNQFQDDHCPLCDDGITLDSQEHVMLCPAIVHQSLVTDSLKYENLFCNDVMKQLQVSSIIIQNFKKRKQKLRKKK